ncbi:LysR family transcriptional regulator [Hydrogenophaga sp.]|uniref:LysR family transcriptional regulator n=1 Tax=Hydrogenophaga sp. TaxID=1904254 RepID=UPI003F6FAA73
MNPSVELNIKKLRVFTQLAVRGNVNAAAEALFLTQSAVSRSLKSLEDDLGCPLFIRSSRGMVLTDVGTILHRRTARAFAYLAHSEEEIRRLPTAHAGTRTRSGFAGRLAQRHITIVPQIGDHRSETSAARYLGISQPAVNAALRDLEQPMGEALFARTSRGMVPTVVGEIVIRAFKLYASEVRSIEGDLAQREGEIRGALVVGCLPLSGAGLLAAVVGRFSQRYPDIRLTLMEAHYEALLNALICGEIDLIVGTLHPAPHAQVLQRPMMTDHLVAVVRAGHPLTRQTQLAVGALEQAQWIVPFRRTATRNTFEKAMLKAGLSTPHGAIEANSVATARAVLLQSDRVSILPRSQVDFDVAAGSLSILPVDLSGAELTLGVATRRDAEPTAGQLSFVDMLVCDHALQAPETVAR